MRTSPTRLIGLASLVLVVASSLVIATPTPSRAATQRQQRIAYVKKIFALPLSDFILEQRHWLPIQKAKDSPAAAHHADWQTDGCSGSVWAWAAIDGEFGGEQWERIFYNACARHDFGYRNFGKGREKGLAYISTPAQRKLVDLRLRADAKAHCSTFKNRMQLNCLAAVAAIYGFVRAKGAYGFYGKGCYPHNLCLISRKSDRSISANTPNLGTRWEFNDQATSARNDSSVAWKVFNDADYRGKWTCVKPGATVTLPRTSSTVLFWYPTKKPAASSVLKMPGRTC